MSLLVAVSLLFASAGAAEPVLVDRIVASVDDRAVTRSMIDARMKLGSTSRTEVRDALIEEQLVQSECDRLRITVESAEIDRAVEAVAASNQITQEQLLASLHEHGYDLESYRRDLRAQLLEMRWVMLQGDRAENPLTMTSAERAAWIDANRRRLLDAARERATIDVRQGEP